MTKLSLLLKVLEGEKRRDRNAATALFPPARLPDLGSNIKCGNSLIGPDFYTTTSRSLSGRRETYRINAFDWQAEFPEIMKAGGFDAVIGNPPYIRIETLKEWANTGGSRSTQKKYQAAASKGDYDIYVVFRRTGT